MNYSFSDPNETRYIPDRIGRYEVEKLIGSGGFGNVYLAKDETLERQVAIKVPHRQLVAGSDGAEEYLREAKMVAGLDHPNIVPVYDVGSTPDIDCFIVSKYIRYTDLRRLLKKERLELGPAINLVKTIAEALHFAHKREVVHRDVKPSNILIDSDGTPFLADFGLALPEYDLGKGPRFAGTPNYMSPEQARGEGHRVDGRSDIFSLGVVLYELIAGKRPFRAESNSDLLEQVEFLDPKPLRQIDETIPKELDRICQKAMAKRASERYWSAHDLAEDLGLFLQEYSSNREPLTVTATGRGSRQEGWNESGGAAATDTKPDSESHSDSQPQLATHYSDTSARAVVVPKGLRSFDSHDADFFHELLPGPKDRRGIPDSLRFWKGRIESRDCEDSFEVGLIYGPSGCGKSSFVKAGLIPCLDSTIVPVFIECNSRFTEQRLLNALRKALPDLDPSLELAETVASIRRGKGVTQKGDKVVLILDQFEQWLHGRDLNQSHELVRAFRQCDGERIQTILMIRSDFWMSITRLLDALEVELVQGKNIAAVDLFPPRHARKVLTAFGRAFGALPDDERLNDDQREFIRQSVEEIAIDGKLICVRLALFAEMMKNRPWTPRTLEKAGGTDGVGVAYLDECFGVQANPMVRFHQSAARSVLKSLLPDSRTVISTTLKSYDELFDVSGYKEKKKFDQLLEILDSEMRLISPTDPAGIQPDDVEADETSADGSTEQRYFKLTHDYLVNALRRWLNRKQRETRKGRAELLLAERATFWNAKHENRYLPSMLEHLQIRTQTLPNQWDSSEKAVMRASAMVHGRWIGTGVVLASVLLLALSFFWKANKNKQLDKDASQLVQNLKMTDTPRVPEVISEINRLRSFAFDDLEREFKSTEVGSDEKLHVAMAMVNESNDYSDYLVSQIPAVEADQLLTLFGTLQRQKEDVIRAMEPVFLNSHLTPRERLAAATALAHFDSENEIWNDGQNRQFVVDNYVKLFPSELAPFRNALTPAAHHLRKEMTALFRDTDRSPKERTFAAEALVVYEAENPEALIELLLTSESYQFPLVYAGLTKHADVLRLEASKEINEPISQEKTDEEQDAAAARQANAAVALYQSGNQNLIWPLLEKERDLRVRSFLIHWLASHDSSPEPLLAKLDSVRSGNNIELLKNLLFSIGEFPATRIGAEDRQQVSSVAERLLRTTKSAELHACASWYLKNSGQSDLVKQIELEQFENEISKSLRQPGPLADSSSLSEKMEDWRQETISNNGSPLEIKGLSGGFYERLQNNNQEFELTGKELSGDESFDVADGPFGLAWKLPGEFAVKLNQNNVPQTESSFAFGCWVQVENDVEYRSVLSRMDPEQDNRGFDIWIDKNGMLCAHIKNKWVGEEDPESRFVKHITDRSVADSQWHHVMVTYDGSGDGDGLKIYLDGSFVEPVETIDCLDGESPATSYPVLIGGRAHDFPFEGKICDVRILGAEFHLEDAPKVYASDLRRIMELGSDPLNRSQRSILIREYLATHPGEVRRAQQSEKYWQEINEQLLADSKEWFYNSQAQLMIKLRAKNFVMGSPPTEALRSAVEIQTTRSLNRTIAIASTEVTQLQWKQYLELGSPSELTRKKFELHRLNSNRPAVGISWFQAAAYCNWLNEMEGIPESQWCYIPHPENGYGEGMKVKPEFWKLTGYRLPTQTEWEFACRAYAETSRHYGSSERILSKYAWYLASSGDAETKPVAMLKPNDFGLSDTHGNAMEWCFDAESDPLPNNDFAPDHPESGNAISNDSRTIRGGAAYDVPQYVRCAHHNSVPPASQTSATGIRIVRTLKDNPDHE